MEEQELPKNTVIRKIRKGLRLLRYSNGRRGLFHGVAMTLEHIPALRGLNPATVVDIGANRGQFSLLCKELFPDASIYSFEPLAGPAGITQSLFRGVENFKLFVSAIDEKSGTAAMNVSRSDDSSSLLPITDQQTEMFPGTEKVDTEQVSVGVLSDYLETSDICGSALLKIDVQGYELNVLKGCGELLDQFDHCYVECSYRELYHGQALAAEIIEFMTGSGFDIVGKFNTHVDRDGAPIQCDILFRRI